MRLSYTIDNFTFDDWDLVFGAFVMVNKSHWKGAPYDAVMNQLKVKGVFEFTVTGMGTWTSKFVLKVLPDKHLDAEFVANEDLSFLMQKHLKKMKEDFEKELEQVSEANS